jgi:hypothetical protein
MEPSMNNGRIPMRMLNNLNEHCAGGFTLFYFNSETGFPEHVTTLDSPIHYLAMQKYMTDWTDSLRDLNIEATKAQIIEQAREDSGEE